MQLNLILEDITKMQVDAIVNAANSALRGGGGVDGAIHKAAGPEMLEELKVGYPNGVRTGWIGITQGYDLPAKVCIHAVGPNYARGDRDPAVLERCYRLALMAADALDLRTIAFPLISAGIYGWPLDSAINIAVKTIRGYQPGHKLELAYLVTNQEDVYKALVEKVHGHSDADWDAAVAQDMADRWDV